MPYHCSLAFSLSEKCQQKKWTNCKIRDKKGRSFPARRPFSRGPSYSVRRPGVNNNNNNQIKKKNNHVVDFFGRRYFRKTTLVECASVCKKNVGGGRLNK